MCENCGCAAHDHNHGYTHVVLPVSGMSCEHCAAQIETGLAKLPGVEQVHADNGAAAVSFVLDTEGDLAAVKETIEDLGFEV